MAKQIINNSKKHEPIKIALGVTGLVVILAALSTLIYANVKLSGPTKQTVTTHDEGLDLDYVVTREPAKPVVGQRVIFKVRVTHNSDPVSNAKFDVDLSRRGGFTIVNITGIPQFEAKEIATDANGSFEFSYKADFDYPFSDPNLISIAPTNATLADRSVELGVDSQKPYMGMRSWYTVYPRWMSWLKFKGKPE